MGRVTSPFEIIELLANAAHAVDGALGSELEETNAPPGDHFAEQFWTFLFFTKSAEWSYEREWRILEQVNSAL